MGLLGFVDLVFLWSDKCFAGVCSSCLRIFKVYKFILCFAVFWVNCVNIWSYRIVDVCCRVFLIRGILLLTCLWLIISKLPKKCQGVLMFFGLLR